MDARLLRPGADWQSGLRLIETENSGYYECLIETEADCGFYEIWDNRGNPNGAVGGKTCTIGKLDARGLQNDCIYGNHILDGVVTGSKIANESIGTEHLQTCISIISSIGCSEPSSHINTIWLPDFTISSSGVLPFFCMVILISFSVTRLLTYGFYIEPVATVVKSFLHNSIRYRIILEDTRLEDKESYGDRAQ